MKDDIPIWMSALVLLATISLLITLVWAIKYLEDRQGEIIKTLLIKQQQEQEIAFANTILFRIAVCESGNTARATNPNSSAKGRFQFIKRSWEYYGKKLWGKDFDNKNILDWDDNTQLARFTYEQNGTKDWEASRHCWDKGRIPNS